MADDLYMDAHLIYPDAAQQVPEISVEVVQTTQVVLTLTEKEARWLNEVMQNPLHGSPEGEDPHSRRMRYKFFKATQVIK